MASHVELQFVGLFARPTMYCECSGKRSKYDGWTKGSKYGWWICTVCGKPSEQWALNMHNQLGTNFLTVEDTND